MTITIALILQLTVTVHSPEISLLSVNYQINDTGKTVSKEES